MNNAITEFCKVLAGTVNYACSVAVGRCGHVAQWVGTGLYKLYNVNSLSSLTFAQLR